MVAGFLAANVDSCKGDYVECRKPFSQIAADVGPRQVERVFVMPRKARGRAGG